MVDDRIPRNLLGAGYPRANAVIAALLPSCERFTLYPLIFADESLENPHIELDPRVEVLHSRGYTGLEATLREYAMRRFDVLWVSRPENMRFVDNALRGMPDVRECFTIVYDAEALYAIRTAQVCALRGVPLDNAASAKLFADEVELAARADVLVSVSAAEAQIFREHTGKPTFVLGFATLPEPSTAGFEARRDFGFLGGVRPDSPNEDSLLWYAANVMHAVHARTGAQFHVAGYTDSQAVLSYAGQELQVHGAIAHPRMLFDNVRVFVAPTRFAAGLPQKLIDAASAGVPIVATSILAKALGWRSGVELMVADTAPRFIEACSALYEDGKLWQTLRENALAAVGRAFGPEIFAAEVAAAIAAVSNRAIVSFSLPPPALDRKPACAGSGETLKLVFVNGYRLFPPLNGGHRRILDVYGDFGSDAEVRFFTLGTDPLDGGYFAIDAERVEVRVPKSLDHARKEAEANGRAGTGVGQIRLAEFAKRTPAFIRVLSRALAEADIAIVGAPYTYPIVRRLFGGPIVYHAHDVEALLQPELVAGAAEASALMEQIEQLEGDCVRDAALIVAMSDDDITRFAERYGVSRERGLALPPSVDLKRAHVRTARTVGTGRLQAVFIGSHWHPNVVGVQALLALAPSLPDVDIAIIGGVADAFRACRPPPNVRFTGYIDAAALDEILTDADVALNPCQAESGVNMKMTDYVLASLPILSTPLGVRGLGFEDGVHARIAPLVEFVSALRALARDDANRSRLAENALLHLRRHFDIEVNRIRLLTRLRALLTVAVR